VIEIERMTPSSQTVDDVPTSGAGLPPQVVEPQLFLVLECDRLAAGGARYSLSAATNVVIGRGPRRAIRRLIERNRGEVRIDVPSQSMSSAHAQLTRTQDGWQVEDLQSRNGTLLNGTSIVRERLKDGDVLELGRTMFIFRAALSVPTEVPADVDHASLARLEPGLSTLLPVDAARISVLCEIAKSAVPILLLGETGTGKELHARAIHAMSGRTGQLIAVNCGALSPSLVDSQLFGHIKGSFSGATHDSIGFYRAADGGTLFLDEIGDLPASAQAALLRTIDQGEVVPVGAHRSVKVNVRIVAATHKAIDAPPSAGQFRSDLLARVAGFTHRLTPLAERREDIGLIADRIFRDLQAPGAPSLSFTPAAARALLGHAWPMNIRELKAALTTASILAKGHTIQPAHLPPSILDSSQRESSIAPAKASLTKEEESLKSELLRNMKAHGGNVAAVARSMGKASTQVYRWLRRFGVTPDDFR
jgi:transcriptional regulator with AAA-type ATPase domain